MTDKKNAEAKGRPTPSRKQQEAAHKRPLVGDKSPEARKAAKAALVAERRAAREGMQRGEDRFLTARDRGPQRRLVRDIVDSRFTAGELVLPAMFVFLIVSSVNNYTVQLVTLISMWLLFAIVVVDAFLLSRKVEKNVAEKFGSEKVERGTRWYAAMRSIQMRPMRLPKPQVKRGKRK